MELPILLLQDALNQQREQLNACEKRNTDPNAPGFEFRKKAAANLKRFIAELEEGINVLTIADMQKEALTITDVVVPKGTLPKQEESIIKESWELFDKHYDLETFEKHTNHWAFMEGIKVGLKYEK